MRHVYNSLGSIKDKVKYQQYDFHHYTSGNNFDSLKVLVTKVDPDIEDHGYFQEELCLKQVMKLQKGVFRTNCLDSLDRTNVGQSKIGLYVL